MFLKYGHIVGEPMALSLKLEKSIIKNISPITDEDRALFNQYIDRTSIEKPGINYENSFEYVQMYFNLGKFNGYKYLEKNVLIIFGEAGTGKKVHIKIFKPLSSNQRKSLDVLTNLIHELKKVTQNQITITFLMNKQLNKLKNQLPINKIKHFEYYLYDLSIMDELKGTKWKNVRQKINTFKKVFPKVRVENLNEMNSKKVIHFISEWRKDAAGRGFSYIDVAKSKYAVKQYRTKIDNENIWSRVYYLHGKIEAFQLLYKILTPSSISACGHAIGIANNDIAGLSEYAQVDTWRYVKEYGVRYVNDGPSWRPGLIRYKKKFNPYGSQHVIECTV
jgi:hypothetical protein